MMPLKRTESSSRSLKMSWGSELETEISQYLDITPSQRMDSRNRRHKAVSLNPRSPENVTLTTI